MTRHGFGKWYNNDGGECDVLAEPTFSPRTKDLPALQKKLIAVNSMKKLNIDGTVNARETTWQRIEYAMQNGLDAVIGRKGTRQYRTVDVDDDYCLTISYAKEKPETLAALTPGEMLPFAIAAEHLGVSTTVLKRHCIDVPVASLQDLEAMVKYEKMVNE